MSGLFLVDYDAPTEKFDDELAPKAVSLNSSTHSFPGASLGDDPYNAPVADVAYEQPTVPIGAWLQQNQYIKWDEGGTPGVGYWLGFDTGMDPHDFRSYAMTGEVAVPENQLALALAERWGDVGTSNYNQELVAGTDQNSGTWLPPANVLAQLALIPGFGTDMS